MNEEKANFFESFFIFCIAGVVTALNLFFCSLAWKWFLVPLGVPSIGMLHIYGLSMLFFLFRSPKIPKLDSREDMINTVVEEFTNTLVFGTIAWIVHFLL